MNLCIINVFANLSYLSYDYLHAFSSFEYNVVTHLSTSPTLKF